MNRFGESDSKAPENVEIPGLGGGVDVADPPPMFDEPNFDEEQVPGFVDKRFMDSFGYCDVGRQIPLPGSQFV